MNNVILTSSAAIVVMLSCVLYASDQIPQDDRQPSQVGSEPRQKGLEQRMSPEERQRFNYNLQNNSGTVYPDFDQVESRRSVMRQKILERFQKIDSDHDNSISRSEAEETMPGLARHFEEIDANHDSIITIDEMKAFYDRKRDMAEKAGKSREALLPVEKTSDKKHNGKIDPNNGSDKLKRIKKQQPHNDTTSPDITSSLS